MWNNTLRKIWCFRLWKELWLNKSWRLMIWKVPSRLPLRGQLKTKSLWRKPHEPTSRGLRDSKLPLRNVTNSWGKRYKSDMAFISWFLKNHKINDNDKKCDTCHPFSNGCTKGCFDEQRPFGTGLLAAAEQEVDRRERQATDSCRVTEKVGLCLYSHKGLIPRWVFTDHCKICVHQSQITDLIRKLQQEKDEQAVANAAVVQRVDRISSENGTLLVNNAALKVQVVPHLEHETQALTNW